MKTKQTKEIKENVKVRFKEILGKKFDSTMIFPLGQFETAFGHLWGHGKNFNELDSQEKMYRKKWNECRDQILHNGNRQKRNANNEIDLHDLEFVGYETMFIPVNKTKKLENV